MMTAVIQRRWKTKYDPDFSQTSQQPWRNAEVILRMCRRESLEVTFNIYHHVYQCD